MSQSAPNIALRPTAPAAPRRRSLRRRETLAGWLFVAPMLAGVTVLTLVPILFMFAMSLADWNFIAGLGDIRWVGLDHFRHLTGDKVFQRSLTNNLIFLVSVPVYMIISFILAVLIHRHVWFQGWFKVVFFLPYISSVVAVATVWQVLFHPSLGPVNQVLRTLGMTDPPKWIADPQFALVSVMMISVWISIGFNMIVYLAGLQAIPKDLYEAAEIDGAGGWTKLTRITVPLVSPTTFFLLITGIIYTFKVFDLIAVLTKGGPANSTTVLVWNIYETAFTHLKVGYASAMSVVLLACVLAITLVQWFGQKRWVNY